MKDYMLDPPDDDDRMDDWINERIDAMMNDEAWIVGEVIDDDDIYQALLLKATELANAEAHRKLMNEIPWRGTAELTQHHAQLKGPDDE